ncbi:MAG: glycerophosphoryl diester phosphodiesterase [Acidimicrobiales bacterium]|jgi:glycerophosphoryl diester phosphodiesterase
MMSQPLGRPMVIGHRGASATHQENTLEAFVAARQQRADGIELDVRRSADDVLVLHHDAHLPDGRLLRDVTADELPDSIPSLAEALEVVGDLFVNIEIKNSPTDPDYDAAHGISMAVAGLMASFDAQDRTLVSSFEMDSILRIRDIDPTVSLGWLTWGQADPTALIGRAAAHQLRSIHPHDLQADRAFVQRAHDAGLAVFVWTVDDPGRMRELAEFGVDGIITNAPEVAVAALTN